MDQWQWLGFSVGVVLTIFIGALAVLVLWLMLTGKIDLSKLISESTGDASLSRFQFLVFTFVIAMSLFYLTAIGSKFPEVPPEILGLLGISGGSYVISKGIQTTRDTSLASDGRAGTGTTQTGSTRPEPGA
jgi:hypothetical protein